MYCVVQEMGGVIGSGVGVPQYVDVEMSGESQRNEENVPHFFRSMFYANLLINLKDKIFDTAVGTSPNLARMCG